MKSNKIKLIIYLLIIGFQNILYGEKGSIEFDIPPVKTKHEHQVDFGFNPETLKFFIQLQQEAKKNGPSVKDFNLKDIIVITQNGLKVSSKLVDIINNFPKYFFYGTTSILFTTGGLTGIGFGIYQASKYKKNENLSKTEIFFRRGICSTLAGLFSLCLSYCVSYKGFQVKISPNSMQVTKEF